MNPGARSAGRERRRCQHRRRPIELAISSEAPHPARSSATSGASSPRPRPPSFAPYGSTPISSLDDTRCRGGWRHCAACTSRWTRTRKVSSFASCAAPSSTSRSTSARLAPLGAACLGHAIGGELVAAVGAGRLRARLLHVGARYRGHLQGHRLLRPHVRARTHGRGPWIQRFLRPGQRSARSPTRSDSFLDSPVWQRYSYCAPEALRICWSPARKTSCYRTEASPAFAVIAPLPSPRGSHNKVVGIPTSRRAWPRSRPLPRPWKTSCATATSRLGGLHAPDPLRGRPRDDPPGAARTSRWCA